MAIFACVGANFSRNLKKFLHLQAELVIKAQGASSMKGNPIELTRRELAEMVALSLHAQSERSSL